MPLNSPIETSGVVKALVWSAALDSNNSHVQFWGDVRANLNGLHSLFKEKRMTDCRYLIKRVIKIIIAVLQLLLLFL